ncbi:MAG: M48 family metallopeptidase [Candidatus Marinimicrobia bacterium]|nr:M48 family metallopeptidase [Candidatus Neomarinimicrobiota bacterium]MCF7828116.1 M48 family metallopeptidase [Candidatus Neomarinimicrobiota bacterium]MCF7879709.1 M48 family metallopeptidase [Candidatus Neomarinimicrobiota bacterium]
MTLERTIHIDQIGPVRFERSKRAQRLNISLRPFAGIRVAVPPGVPLHTARKFVLSKQRWLARRTDQMRETEAQHQWMVDALRDLEPSSVKKELRQRLDDLSQRHMLPYNAMTLRHQKTRWGSCSSQNNISLNIQLVLLPDEFCDYVLTHELVHTEVKNHGTKFWEHLGKIIDHPKRVDSQLRQYPIIPREIIG